MSVIANSERLKQVMRIALVGIRPADQVMLKGYLRILLRLEADLEWVSANNDVVDLFMINNEFVNSESVQRLLSAKPTSAVLYINRNETGDGYLAGNILTLPLKELDILSQWLASNVKFLAGTQTGKQTTSNQATSNTLANQPSTTPPADDTPDTTNRPLTRQSLDDILASRSAAANAQSAPTNQPATSQAPATPSQPSAKNSLLSLLNVIMQLQRHEDSLLSLVDETGQILAHIQPKQQRIWQVATDIALNQNLSLSPADKSLNADPKQSLDLVQWLWQQAITQAPQLTAVLRPKLAYHITSWVKPAESDIQHDQLKIQGVLESRTVTLGELAQLSQCDHNTIKRTIIGLVIAGVMPATVYQELEQQLQAVQASQVSSQPEPIAISQPIQDIPSQPMATTSHAATDSVAQEIKATESNDNMKGFLSRLRRKLGI